MRRFPLFGNDDVEGSDSGSQPVIPKRRRTGLPPTNTQLGAATESSMLGAFPDSDVLDCPICCEALTIPVFQCANGHLLCSSCCIRIGEKCPSCTWPLGHNRCRSIERILESVKFSCLNLEYGCKETMLYSKREEHAKGCKFAPCSCPYEGCDFVASAKKLNDHFSDSHARSAIQFDFKYPTSFWLKSDHRSVIFQEITDGTIFVLNYTNNCVPRALNLICIGPSHFKEKYYYKLSVTVGNSTLELKSVAATMPKWSENQPLTKYLPLPSDFQNSCYHTRVIVNIERR